MSSTNPRPSAKEKLLAMLAEAVRDGLLVKLTLGSHRGADASLRNVFVRPVALRSGPHLSFVFRHATRDVTQNFAPEEGLARIGGLLGGDFRSANLFTTERSAQLQMRDGKAPRLVLGKAGGAGAADADHDRSRKHLIEPASHPWLRELGVTTPDDRVAKGMEAKFRQINKFVELLGHLLSAFRTPHSAFNVVDMGCGKGYLTFAAYAHLHSLGSSELSVRGVEARPELVALCNRAARDCGCERLTFEAGTIEETELQQADVLMALHACDTATDDAIAKGVAAGAALILVSPCCHKELRPQLRPPPVLAGALRHGILRERHAEFVTDALRAALLEWAGYDTKVFEFIATEHTSKNLMIAATKRAHPANRDELARKVRELAAFYGIRAQRLAGHLGVKLTTMAES